MGWPLLLFLALADGELTGRIRAPVPSTLTARVGEQTVTCPIGADHSFRCALPAGRHDVRLAADGYAPRYLFDVQAGEIGEIVLTRGASVAGWVEGGTDVTIELSKAARTKANARGFFQFVNVEPGMYTVVASQKGLSPARAELSVREMREHVLDRPLTLQPLAAVELFLSPPLAPGGLPWKVRLLRGSTAVVFSEAGPDGVWRRADVETGPYVVQVAAGDANYLTRDLQVEPDMPSMALAIAAVPVKGSVRHGTEPLPSRLRLWTTGGQSLTVETDETGHFETLLPAEGRWRVDVKAARQNLTTKTIEVRRRDAEEYARLDIQLPGGRVTGRVVDENGQPVEAGVALIRAGTPEAETRTDGEGHFELIGLDEGAFTVQAVTRTAESGAVPHVVSSGSAPLTLVMQKRQTVEGWLTTPSGHAVAGAEIRYANPALGLSRRALSGPSGRFTLTLPPQVTALELAIAPPGLPAKLTTVALNGDRLHVTINDRGGRLLIRLGRTPPWPFVIHGGATSSLLTLLPQPGGGAPPPWLSAEGVTVDLEAGEYTVCPARALDDRCKTAVVVPGGLATVEVR